MTTAVCPSLHWRLGREYWRVDRDEGFRKPDYGVDLIKDSVARKFVVEHHYSGSYLIAIERVGLFNGTHLVAMPRTSQSGRLVLPVQSEILNNELNSK